MSTDIVEFRAIIKYLLKKQMNGKEIINELIQVYGEGSPSKTTVYYWIN